MQMKLEMLHLIARSMIILLSLTSQQAIATAGMIRAELTHVDAGKGLSKAELLHRMVVRSLSSSSSTGGVSAPTNQGGAGFEYVMNFAIGTPPQPVALLLDTGSDLVWTQCTPCAVDSCFDQPFPLFSPANSSTYTPLPCNSPLCQAPEGALCVNQSCVYKAGYGDKSYSNGILSGETFTFGDSNVTVPGLGFGCGNNNTEAGIFNQSGIAGFGRGALSLPSQLGVSNFSYCLVPYFSSESSSVFLGLPADLYAGNANASAIMSTPLVQGPAGQPPSHYYLNMEGITVGSTRLPLTASNFTSNGTSSVVIDSGTSITSLTAPVYQIVRSAFMDQVQLPLTNSSLFSKLFDLCFVLPAKTSAAEVPVPDLVFHFEGADMDLSRDNYLPNIGDGTMCLTLDSAPGGFLQSFSALIGNIQQQNMHILYDLDNEMLSFVQADCNQI